MKEHHLELVIKMSRFKVLGFMDRENRLDDATHGDIMGQTLPSRGTYNSPISTR